MKSNLSFIVFLSASLIFISCKKEEEAEVTSSDQPKQILGPIPDVQSTTNQNFGQANTTQNMVAPNQATVQNVAPPPTQAGMNPPHGQPGHRCDISVGAPLNSPPGNAGNAGSAITQKITPSFTTTTKTSQPSATPTIISSDAPVATAPGMNPPHGQPGHVCGTPVGSPLPKEGETPAAGTQQ